MSFNTSSASNGSLVPPSDLSSSNSSAYHSSANCLNDRTSFFIFTAFCASSIVLLLPLCLMVIYLALRRWKAHRAGTTATTSQADIIAYHLVAMEMIGISGCALYCCGACLGAPWPMRVGVWLYSATSYGQVFFHILTCVERHLAVVHPITYLGLRSRSAGVRVRDVAIGCVWLLFLGSFLLESLAAQHRTVSGICISTVAIVIISFCSISVLCALIRPGPGDRQRESPRLSTMRAFYTIMSIMGALLVRFAGCLLVLAVYSSSAVREQVRCGILVSGVWFCLPSSLVIPLLFLQRAGKLVCCKNNPNQENDESRAP